MSYLVLARKYRPKTFEELAGQEVVKRTLKGAIDEARIGHAYLFTGPRGTGKTTTARIFAKALNCESGPTPNPCGTCERCQAIEAGAEADVIEIDAASHTGVEDIRTLRDQAGYVPMRARHKIYIVDEVHMLSRSAFNALLKTLEEPPPHVKFLFATTELHKVIDTILSRCQVLKLTPLTEDTIVRRLDEVFQAEGIQAEEGVSADLARRARGGMRDALSLADQLLALVGTKPTVADVQRMGGAERSGAGALVDLVQTADKPGVMQSLPATEGGEAELLSSLLDHLRACLLAALCGPGAPMLAGLAESEDGHAEFAARGKRIGAAKLELWLQELLHARERMRLLPSHARLILEVTLLDLCDAHSAVPLVQIAERLERLEAALVSGAPLAAAPRTSPPPMGGASEAQAAAAPPEARRATVASRPSSEPARPALEPNPAKQAQPLAASSSKPSRVRTNSTADAWQGFLAELAQRAPSLAMLIERRGSLVQYAEGRAVVRLEKLARDEAAMIQAGRNRKLCGTAFEAAVGSPVEVDLQNADEAAPGSKDSFTANVAERFQGRIED